MSIQHANFLRWHAEAYGKVREHMERVLRDKPAVSVIDDVADCSTDADPAMRAASYLKILFDLCVEMGAIKDCIDGESVEPLTNQETPCE